MKKYLQKKRCKIQAPNGSDKEKAQFAKEKDYCPNPEEMGWE